MTSQHHQFSIGPFSLRSLSQRMEDGRYRASVAIRSGQGSATTGRLIRFDERFDSDHAAHDYARDQGLDWARAGCRPDAFSC
ncbi:hypothetical protein [Derxia lacustris]|uniref:hypothetical protein n=1 Tax=Derxia lacustris TaxID=764842 RepID=UPI000A1757AF|nr:hypothetical protein [Derxia lacustris]